jgi:hypothetical protein
MTMQGSLELISDSGGTQKITLSAGVGVGVAQAFLTMFVFTIKPLVLMK